LSGWTMPGRIGSQQLLRIIDAGMLYYYDTINETDVSEEFSVEYDFVMINYQTPNSPLFDLSLLGCSGTGITASQSSSVPSSSSTADNAWKLIVGIVVGTAWSDIIIAPSKNVVEILFTAFFLEL